VPGIAGPQHAQKAIEAALMILRDTGHADPGGPWIPVGVGVHTGIAYLGTVGTRGGAIDFTALGDAPNVAARLASNAAAGEVLISDVAWEAAGSGLPAAEAQTLHVKGRSQPVQVRVLRVSPEIV
jgi:adenylate cyclase